MTQINLVLRGKGEQFGPNQQDMAEKSKVWDRMNSGSGESGSSGARGSFKTRSESISWNKQDGEKKGGGEDNEVALSKNMTWVEKRQEWARVTPMCIQTEGCSFMGRSKVHTRERRIWRSTKTVEGSVSWTGVRKAQIVS